MAAPKRWIDPQKESRANQLALQSGQKTFKQIAAENGRDWRGQLEDIAEVQRYAQSLGIRIGGEGIGTDTENETGNDAGEEL